MNTTQLFSEVGRLVREARDRHPERLSQADLARAVGVDRVSITNLESGKHVSLRLLVKVAHALEVELRDLIPLTRGAAAVPTAVPAKTAAVMDAVLGEMDADDVR